MYGKDGTTPRAVEGLSPEEQSEALEEWFRSKYESPNERTPYEGEFIWIWGGPFDAREELYGRYKGFVADDVIEELADRLSDENPEWAPVESIDDYDFDLLGAIESSSSARRSFGDSCSEVHELLWSVNGTELETVQCKLLYSYVMTALECYLCDTFAQRVLEDSMKLRVFIETTPEFQDLRIPFAHAFQAAEDSGEEAAKYLAGVVWHNLWKVAAMFKATFGIDFGAHLGILMKRVAVRHDIVHRNGHDKDGKPIDVTADDVRGFMQESRELVDLIEDGF